MEPRQLQKEITACLWSDGLRNAIEEKKYTFTEVDLLGIAFHFAPSFEERLRLLKLLEDYAPSVSAHAARCIDWQNRSLEAFRSNGEGEIYELRIKNEPDAYEERYLCATFDAALEMIDGFWQEYDFSSELKQTRYVIEKRHILRTGEPFQEDSLGECILSAGKVLVSVDGLRDESENGSCPHDCSDCAISCVANIEVSFPAFLPERTPVRWYAPDGSVKYGVHLNFHHAKEMDFCYIIPFDTELLTGRAYEQHWGGHWHEHILCPYVEEVPVDELPEKLRENYFGFCAWLDAREEF
ncbi:MAG: hypothetical protein IJ960_06935 [Oscillospiraceae bacterium]|nr:hypothetical protein [Oscillospiraceae bacterium]